MANRKKPKIGIIYTLASLVPGFSLDPGPHALFPRACPQRGLERPSGKPAPRVGACFGALLGWGGAVLVLGTLRFAVDATLGAAVRGLDDPSGERQRRGSPRSP